jgi:hypothetical protein
MPPYVSSPYDQCATLLPGVNAYSFGSFDDHNPGTKIEVQTFGIAADVGTITGLVVEGQSGILPGTPKPIPGELISLRGLGSSGGEISAAVIHAGNAGTGFAVGDTVEVIGGGGTGAVLAVATESAGVPETWTVTEAGEGYTTGTNIAIAVLTGSGTPGTVDITADAIVSEDVTNAVILSYSITSAGIATVTFTIDADNVAAGPVQGVWALIPAQEIGEAFVEAAGKQFAMQAFQGLASNSRDISWCVGTPSAPGSFTMVLQTADVNQDSEYTTIDTATATGMRTVIGVRANFIRAKCTAFAGGSSPTVVVKILE